MDRSKNRRKGPKEDRGHVRKGIRVMTHYEVGFGTAL